MFVSKFHTLCGNNEARDSAVGCGTALQTRRSRVRLYNPFGHTTALGSTQTNSNEYQEYFLGVKAAGVYG